MTNVLRQPEDRIMDELVVRARWERDAFGRLYDRMYPPVFRYCIRRTGDRSLAEDITSTVFLNVANKIAAFPGETYVDFRRWVFVIATNELKATYRKSSRRQSLLIEAAESGRLPGNTSDDASGFTFEMDSVQAAIQRLTQRDQSIITLRFFSELSYEDIGHILQYQFGSGPNRGLTRARQNQKRGRAVVMNSQEQPMHERQAFDELLGDDSFDDSVCDKHQSDLRSKVLQAFDRPNRKATLVDPHMPSTAEPQHASWNRSHGLAAVAVVCLIGLVAVWFYRWNGSVEHAIVEHPSVPDATEDSQLFASLAELNAFRDEVSREEYFLALAVCHQEHEGRMLFETVQP